MIFTLYLYYKDCIKLHESLLRGKGDIYSLVNAVNGKQYIGSAKIFNVYLKYKNNSNAVLQNSLCKIWSR